MAAPRQKQRGLSGVARRKAGGWRTSSLSTMWKPPSNSMTSPSSSRPHPPWCQRFGRSKVSWTRRAISSFCSGLRVRHAQSSSGNIMVIVASPLSPDPIATMGKCLRGGRWLSAEVLADVAHQHAHSHAVAVRGAQRVVACHPEHVPQNGRPRPGSRGNPRAKATRRSQTVRVIATGILNPASRAVSETSTRMPSPIAWARV